MIRAQKESYGDGLDENFLHPYMWACKSHYYSSGYNFYNFPYAFGLLFGKGVFARWLEKGESFVPDYCKLLRFCGSAPVADVAASVDIDVRSEGFWCSSLEGIQKDIDEFCRRFRHFPVQVESSLHILQRAGYIEYTEMQESMARVHFLVTRETLYRLENAGESEDKVIVAILRNYGGLFSDFGFIDESIIARDTHLSVHQVYMSLRNLHQRHILHFIPRKQTPYIRYTQRRDDGCHLHFPPSIYEELKERYAARIEAMISYATNDSISRSQQLLRYFGESSEPVSL
jgi:hypothetical protein